MKSSSRHIAWLLAGGCLLFLIIAPLAMAQIGSADDSLGVGYMEGTGLSQQDPRVAAARIIQIGLGLLGTIAVVLVIYAGFLWMTSEGNADKLQKAKQILKSAAIGLLIILSAFAIVTFVIDRLNSALDGGSGQTTVDSVPDNSLIGLGALGSGIVQSVYPSPGQTDVPRNTGIIITFREKMKVSTICQGGDDATSVCNNANIVADNIKFFQTEVGDNSATNLAANKIKVSTNDGLIFVFAPVDYLGSASGNVWQSVKLTTGLRKANNQPAFNLGDFIWQFEISTRVDLTPPQVKLGGILPFPDNGRDLNLGVQAAQVATATIQVLSIPQSAAIASVGGPVPYGASGSARIEGDYNCANDGTIFVSVVAGNPLRAQAVGISGLINDEDVSDGRISLGCGLTLIKNGSLAPDNHGTLEAGNGWNIIVKAFRHGEILSVGSQSYRFVNSADNNPNHIVTATSLGAMVNNIVNKINQTNIDVSASNIGSNVILLQSKVAGSSGNSLNLSTDSASLYVSSFSGGLDRRETIDVQDLPDTPRNSIIQLNFSEPINPLTVVGDSNYVSNTIRVINTDNNQLVSGRFVISNQYQTLEFIPNVECGVNACGDKIYCLPASSSIAVELRAAPLASCSSNPDCFNKAPYNQCAGGSCRRAADDYYPLAALPLSSGLVDASFNSLDGNRDSKTTGPTSFYSENSKNLAQKDSYKWSFFVNDQIDLTPPRLQSSSLLPGLGLTSGLLNQPIEFSFDKLMMASTLNSGDIIINNQNHRLINLFSAGVAPSYWVVSQAIDSGVPDGYPDFTKVIINHGQLSDATKYFIEVGSGVKDSRQNCFKPCRDDGACSASSASCCNGYPFASSTCIQ